MFAKIDFVINADLCSAIKRQTQYAKEQERHDTLPDTRRAVEQYVAVEEKELKSAKTDTSLYKGVPS